MQYAILDGQGTVVNLIEYDGAAEFDPGPGLTLTPATADHVYASSQPRPAPAPVPSPMISKRQMLSWLLVHKNKTDADILAALDTISDATAKAQAKINYLYPDGPFHRSNTLFDQLGVLFSMSPADIDAAFVAAARL